MDSSRHVRFDRGTLHALTFLVAFCSFAYELVYAELLTVIYGGTVTQYGLTVGLFFSSLGIGSFLARTLDHDRRSNFFRTEVALALVAPVGFVVVLWIGSATVPDAVPRGLVGAAARVPIVLVGIFSGFELPLLTAMVEDVEGDPSPHFRAVRRRLRTATYRVVGTVFHVNRAGNDQDRYSTVLGMDYLGGLAGSLVYVFVLYPDVGLLATIFVLGLLNAVAALLFVARFSDRSWTGFTTGRTLTSRERRSILAVCLLLTGLYGGLVVQHQTVDRRLNAFYFERSVEREYPSGEVDVTVTGATTTPYQRAVFYNRSWQGQRDNPYFPGETERCFRLDTAVQLCDSWADSYHQGLVDVPMSRYPNGSDTRVLVVGGGDWIAVDHLRKYDVTVDMVDLDGTFLELTKNHTWFEGYHHDAYRYDRLNVTVADAHRYLTATRERYDLILLDLPGATDDDLLGLYSTQFYRELREHLRPDGVVATWTYTRAGHAQHHAAYTNTVRAAGFEQQLPYWAWEDVDEDGAVERVEHFVLLSPSERPGPPLPARTAYVRRFGARYDDATWEPIPYYRGVEPNDVFDPNYDILIDT
jgi:spermidine synthase